ncbi:MAG: zinc-dependent metalloprotease [Candidatus Symbiothrix sp.]|jgi:hypothetical protein|nr:zinc-dependent metalloprotease [Candidatus Symbiothrix sp.]
MKKTFLITLLIACALQMQAQFLIGSPDSRDVARHVSTEEWAAAKAVHGDMFVRAGIVVLNRADINDQRIQTALRTQDLLSIQLFDDVSVTAKKTNVRTTGSGGIYWTGTIVETQFIASIPNGELTLFMKNNYLAGTLRQGDQVFDITSDENGNLKVVELDQNNNPAPNEDCYFHEEVETATSLQQSTSGLRAATADPSTDAEGHYIIDILVLYPTATATLMGANAEARTTKAMAILEEANECFENSHMNLRFRLAHDEINNDIAANATSADAVRLSSITAMRNDYGADIVTHWNSSGSDGTAFVYGGNAGQSGYNTSKYSEVISRYTFVHEAGHNLGGRHDRYEYRDQTSYLTNNPGDNFGKCFLTYRTIMAYDNSKQLPGAANVGRSRIKAFSNPDVSYNPDSKIFGTGSANGFVPTGIAITSETPISAIIDGGPANNARYMSANASAVSAVNNPITTQPTFTLKVTDGTPATVVVTAGTSVEITANAAPEGQVFAGWVSGDRGSIAGILDDPTKSTTNVNMLSKDLWVKATYIVAEPGTETKPFPVANRADLEKIKDDLSSYYILTDDIDLAGSDWTPIAGIFTGTLWGEGHAIKNISINTSVAKVGLFADLGNGAFIEGVNIVGGNITSSAAGAQVGAIAGYISNANVIITKCSNTATITATGATAQVGGLVGSIKGAFATISSSFNKGNVTGGQYVGGIVGRGADGQNTVTISNCYSQATVSSAVASAYVAGIAGYLYSGRGIYTVENCYATGSVENTGNGSAVGIVGRAWDNAGTIIQHNVALQDNLTGSDANTVAILGSEVNTGTKENYSNAAMLLNGVAKTDESAKNGTAVSLNDAKTVAFYTTAPLAWDFTDTWTITDGSFPYFQWEKAGNVGIELPKVVNPLKASASNGILTVKGLVAGEFVRVYTLLGQTVSSWTATSTEKTISLPASGIYIVAAGNKAVKVLAEK